MPYLRYKDYAKTIQDANMLQIIASDDTIRLEAEVAAEAEVKGYLSQKYDVVKEFTDTTLWDIDTVYKGNNLVWLDATAYNAATVYNPDDLMAFTDGKVWACVTLTTAGQTPVTHPAKWAEVGTRYKLYYVTLPAEEFNYKKYYTKDDEVFYKDKVYTALIDTPAMDHQTALQYGRIASIPAPNVFPDDPIDGAKYWGAGVAYSVAAGTLTSDATKWTAGDNRSAMIVQKTMDVCLYHLHSRIAPRNIPQLRMDRYAAATAYLQAIAEGVVTADIPLLQPKTNGMIRFGSDVRRINDF